MTKSKCWDSVEKEIPLVTFQILIDKHYSIFKLLITN